MNPEEGELRPQLLDRFGPTVDVRAARDVETRVEVVRRRLAFEADPAEFVAAWQDAERATARRIAEARQRVGAVVRPDAELRRIAAVCAAFDVDGMRADLVIARAATAHAAWRGAGAVIEQDVRVAARLALPHRARRDPFDEPGIDADALDAALRAAAG
jgi:magnesium chelatase subunit D